MEPQSLGGENPNGNAASFEVPGVGGNEPFDRTKIFATTLANSKFTHICCQASINRFNQRSAQFLNTLNSTALVKWWRDLSV